MAPCRHGATGKDSGFQRTLHLKLSDGELGGCLRVLIHCATLSLQPVLILALDDSCMSRGECCSA